MLYRLDLEFLGNLMEELTTTPVHKIILDQLVFYIPSKLRRLGIQQINHQILT